MISATPSGVAAAGLPTTAGTKAGTVPVAAASAEVPVPDAPVSRVIVFAVIGQ